MSLLLAGALLLAPGARAARLVQAPLPDDPMQVSVHRLANGLTVYLSPDHRAPRVYSAIVARVGAKNDPAESTGMAHYLEHLLFKGSERLGTLDYAQEKPHLDRIAALYDRLPLSTAPLARETIFRAIDAESVRAAAYAVPNEFDRLYNVLGVTGVNARTTDESTVFVSEFPSNRAEAWAVVEADRFAHPVFRLFQSELESIYEEKNRSLDDADERLRDAIEARLYKVHPYGQRSILGSIEHLRNPSLSGLAAFYRAYYRPANMAIVLSGDFDRDAMLALIERHFGAWRPGPTPPEPAWPLPPPRGEETAELRLQAEPAVDIAWLTVPANDPDEDALEVMDMVMDNSQAGLVNLRLNQAQRVQDAGSYPVFYNDAGHWTLWATPKKGQTLEEARALLLETVGALQAGEFSEDDVRAVITDFEVGEKRRLESEEARTSAMVDAFTTGQSWAYAASKLERLRRVGKADVVRVARRYLGPDRVVVYRREGKPDLDSLRKPGFTKIEIDPRRESPFFRRVLALPAKPIEPRFLRPGKDYVRREEPWGRLYASDNPVNDLFSLTFSFDLGRDQERSLCQALRLLDLSGAGELPAEQFKRRLYALGSAMSLDCDERETSVTLTGLDGGFDETLALARRRFERPRTDKDTLRKMVEIELGERADNKKSQGYLLYALSELAERGARSAVLRELTDRELRRLREEDLESLVTGLFAYRRDVLYVGPRPAEALEPALAWGAAPYREPPPGEPIRYERPAKARVLFLPREQAQDSVGAVAADEPYDPDHSVDYLYYNLYMGGGMSGVLFQEIRESRALAYSASGGYSGGERKGDENLVWGALGTQADKAVESSELLRGLLSDMPLSLDRFQETRRAVDEDFRTDVLGFREIPATVEEWERKGIAGDPRPERFRRARAYRPEDLAGFAGRFKEKRFTVYVLGDPKRTDLQRLSRLGELRELKLSDLFPY